MIRDNGRGIAPDRLADIQKRLKEEQNTFESIGLSNVLQRIRLRFGDEYGLIIDSTVDAGTEVQISMPIIGGNEQDV
jgi:two-component system sensor histidine kinase YesM